tara:strand:+ start:137 stop:517 length:381 start_codon:yes stop_codon:yes gene_type:complete
MTQTNLILLFLVTAVLIAVTATALFVTGIVSFTTIDAPRGTDPEATMGDTLLFLDEDGIEITGDASADSITIKINLATATTSVTGSATGFEFISDAVTLISGCDDQQVLKWIETAGVGSWNCADDD